MGVAAVECLTAGDTGCLVGLVGGRIERTPLSEVAGKQKPLDLGLLDLAGVLSA